MHQSGLNRVHWNGSLSFDRKLFGRQTYLWVAIFVPNISGIVNWSTSSILSFCLSTKCLSTKCLLTKCLLTKCLSTNWFSTKRGGTIGIFTKGLFGNNWKRKMDKFWICPTGSNCVSIYLQTST
jgi:hypothetical protein